MMAGSKMPIPQRRTAMHAGPGTLLMPELHLPKSHGRVNHHPRPNALASSRSGSLEHVAPESPEMFDSMLLE
jgi:hypothetical protein